MMPVPCPCAPVHPQLHGRLAALADAVELLHKKASTKGAETKLLKAMQRVCKLPTLQQVGALMQGDGFKVSGYGPWAQGNFALKSWVWGVGGRLGGKGSGRWVREVGECTR